MQIITLDSLALLCAFGGAAVNAVHVEWVTITKVVCPTDNSTTTLFPQATGTFASSAAAPASIGGSSPNPFIGNPFNEFPNPEGGCDENASAMLSIVGTGGLSMGTSGTGGFASVPTGFNSSLTYVPTRYAYATTSATAAQSSAVTTMNACESACQSDVSSSSRPQALD